MVISAKAFTSLKLSHLIAKIASDNKAEDIIILDMRKVVNFCDYFVVMSGNSERQVRALADHIDDEIHKIGAVQTSQEGFRSSDWIVIDTGDVITHIFKKSARNFYQLEFLWREAKRVPWQDPLKPTTKS